MGTEARDNATAATPLHTAAKMGYLEMVMLLLDSGADVNTRYMENVSACARTLKLCYFFCLYIHIFFNFYFDISVLIIYILIMMTINSSVLFIYSLLLCMRHARKVT